MAVEIKILFWCACIGRVIFCDWGDSLGHLWLSLWACRGWVRLDKVGYGWIRLGVSYLPRF